jgi:hypothetical protein
VSDDDYADSKNNKNKNKSKHARSAPIPIKQKTNNVKPTKFRNHTSRIESNCLKPCDIKSNQNVHGGINSFTKIMPITSPCEKSNGILSTSLRSITGIISGSIPNHTNTYTNTYSNSFSLNSPGIRGESFGTIHPTELSANDISIVDDKNNDNKKYFNTTNQQARTTDSGLIDLKDMNNMFIENIPEKATTCEYIYNSSSDFGSYVYSKSAPIASSIASGIASGVTSGLTSGLTSGVTSGVKSGVTSSASSVAYGFNKIVRKTFGIGLSTSKLKKL